MKYYPPFSPFLLLHSHPFLLRSFKSLFCTYCLRERVALSEHGRAKVRFQSQSPVGNGEDSGKWGAVRLFSPKTGRLMRGKRRGVCAECTSPSPPHQAQPQSEGMESEISEEFGGHLGWGPRERYPEKKWCKGVLRPRNRGQKPHTRSRAPAWHSHKDLGSPPSPFSLSPED